MGLVPAIRINFDGGGGLAADDDYVVDAEGVGHFHPLKAGSTWRFDLKFTGVDTTGLSWAMQVRANYAAATPILDSAANDDTEITITPNPTGADTERLRIEVAPPGTALLQSNGSGTGFVWDLEAINGADRDRWAYGSGTVTPEVTR